MPATEWNDSTQLTLARAMVGEADWHERSLSRRDPARIIGGPDGGVPILEASALLSSSLQATVSDGSS